MECLFELFGVMVWVWVVWDCFDCFDVREGSIVFLVDLFMVCCCVWLLCFIVCEVEVVMCVVYGVVNCDIVVVLNVFVCMVEVYFGWVFVKFDVCSRVEFMVLVYCFE